LDQLPLRVCLCALCILTFCLNQEYVICLHVGAAPRAKAILKRNHCLVNAPGLTFSLFSCYLDPQFLGVRKSPGERLVFICKSTVCYLFTRRRHSTRHALAFTRYSFVYSGTVHLSILFLAFNMFIASPTVVCCSHYCAIYPSASLICNQHTMLVMAVSCKGKPSQGEIPEGGRARPALVTSLLYKSNLTAT